MNREVKFICNNEEISTSSHPATTVLDFVRKELKLTGTKEGCREGDCGACTVLVGELFNGSIRYHAVNSCLLPLGDIQGKHLVTIEGLNRIELNPMQQALVDEGGTQCGFCTPGFIISMTGYLLCHNNFNYADFISSLDGNVCRCTGYASIKRAAQETYDFIRDNHEINDSSIDDLVEAGFVPDYFLRIPERILNLQSSNGADHGNIKKASRIIAGGTDIFVKDGDNIDLEEVKLLMQKKKMPAIWTGAEHCFVSASATVNDIRCSPIMQNFFPKIKEYFDLFGSQPIRNRATLGGNIINASPIGDMTIFFLALNSNLFLSDGDGIREIGMKDFFKSYKTLDKKDNEILEYISFVVPPENTFVNFEKVSRRTHLDIASVNSAVYIEAAKNIIGKIAISAGGVAPVPLLLRKTSAFLTNKEISSETVKDAAEIAAQEISPISDVRGSAEYKTILLRQLIFAHFLRLFPAYLEEAEFA